MKRAIEFLPKWRKRYAAVCKKHEGGYERIPSFCWCESSAQVMSYIESVIPDGYQQFEISDFTGYKKGENKKLISDKIVSEARTAVINYCWNDIDPDEMGNFDLVEWYPKSAMRFRRKNANNLVIYGDPYCRQNANGIVKTFKNPLGRTMLAAVVMKQAIRERLKIECQGESYAWVSYSRLYTKLMQNALNQTKDEKDFDSEISEYEEADWLCVDGFETEKTSDASRTFRTRVLDNFFEERLKNGRPNILVFQENLEKIDDLRSEFGISINTIINSDKTTRVKLLEAK